MLLTGETATFANYTSYDNGINGIMVDIADLPDTPTAADFAFVAGNDNTPSGWSTSVISPTITVDAGNGTDGSDRIVLIWPDYNSGSPYTTAVAKQWLQITVKATENTGISADDVFYVGNAIGECDQANTATHALVTNEDKSLMAHYIGPAIITSLYDLNRDGFVTAIDMMMVINNVTDENTALRFITPTN